MKSVVSLWSQRKNGPYKSWRRVEDKQLPYQFGSGGKDAKGAKGIPDIFLSSFAPFALFAPFASG